MTDSSFKAIFGSVAVSIAFVMELTLVPLLLPAIQSQFDLSIGEIAWVFNSYGAAVALGVLLGGWLGDTFNTRRVFSAGVIFFAAGSIVVAVADSYPSIITGRVLQGLGGGIFSPLTPLLLTRATPNRPGKVLIVWGSVAGYVAASTPFFYSNVLAGYGWNLAFLIFAAVSMAALGVMFRSQTWDEPASTSHSRPSYSLLWGARDLWVMSAYVFCTYGSITYYLFRLPLWLSESQYQVVSIGMNLTLLWLSFSIVSTLLRNLVDAPYVRRILLAAPVLIAAGYIFALFSSSVTCLMLASGLVGAGLACSNAPSTQLILKFAPKGLGALAASFSRRSIFFKCRTIYDLILANYMRFNI